MRLVKSAIRCSFFGARIRGSRLKDTWREKEGSILGVGFAVLSHDGGCTVEC